MKKTLFILKTAGTQSLNDQVSTLSSSLAYSTVFSIAPLLIIITGLVGFFYGNHGDVNTIYSSVRQLVGPEGAKAIQGMVEAAAKKPETGLLTTISGIVMVLLGAASVFQQLQQSLNTIWKVRTTPKGGIKHFIKQKFLSFSMIVVIALLLLVSLFLNTGISIAWSLLGDGLPGGQFLWHSIEFISSFAIITLLFAAVFKILPDVELKWKDVFLGAIFTSFLFNIGKFLMAMYLAKGSVASAYGAAGSLVVVLLWVYYSSAILFFGAEFTRALVMITGQKITPKEDAELISINTVQENHT